MSLRLKRVQPPPVQVVPEPTYTIEGISQEQLDKLSALLVAVDDREAKDGCSLNSILGVIADPLAKRTGYLRWQVIVTKPPVSELDNKLFVNSLKLIPWKV